MTVLWICLAGGLGAVARHLVDTRLKGIASWPAGVLVVNVLGSFLLGVVSGVPGWGAVVGTGFCGGFTTFSTACVEHLALARRRNGRVAALHVGVMLLACVCAAAAGMAISPQ